MSYGHFGFDDEEDYRGRKAFYVGLETDSGLDFRTKYLVMCRWMFSAIYEVKWSSDGDRHDELAGVPCVFYLE
jgi:hypothetical protein